MILALAAVVALIMWKGDEGVSYMQAKITPSIPDWDHLFKREAQKFGLDWKLLKAIAMKESTLGRHPTVIAGLKNPSDIEASKSEDGLSWGLMQLRPSTARDFDTSATAQKLNNPEYSVKIAAQFLAWIQLQFKDTPKTEYIVKAYNQGVRGTKEAIAGLREDAAVGYWNAFQKNYAIIKGEV